MRTRKPSEILRATVSQEVRKILGPEIGVSAESGLVFREVQILIPPEPRVNVGVTVPGEEPVAPKDTLDRQAGLNRAYRLAEFPPGAQIKMNLLPDQALYAVAQQGIGFVTIIVVYVAWES